MTNGQEHVAARTPLDDALANLRVISGAARVEIAITGTEAEALLAERDDLIAALREIERWPAPIDGGKVRAVASAALGKVLRHGE